MAARQADIFPLSSKSVIEKFLRQDTFLHIYSIGDLDSFFWPNTTWYGYRRASKLEAVVLLYDPGDQIVLLALCAPRDTPAMLDLLAGIEPILPQTFYLHASPEIAHFFQEHHTVQDYGKHIKMALRRYGKAKAFVTGGTEAILPEDLDQLAHLYEISYPDNAFDPRMLETGQFYGIKLDGQIISAAGIHVYSKKYKVAALGNVVTHPAHRGKGLGTAVTARTVQSLQGSVVHIGLNVKADNAAAIRSYHKLGFVPHASYQEMLVHKK